MVELEHLSYSSVSSYLLCPQAWYRHYVLKEQTPTAPALVFGTAFHEAVEQLIHRTRYRGEAEVDSSGIFAVCWEKVIEGQEIDWQDQNRRDLANAGMKMISHPDVQQILGTLLPMVDDQGPMIERRIELRVPGVPIPVIGYIDCITEEGIPLDIKTASRMWTQEQAEKELQPAFYLAALNQASFTHNPEQQFIHWVTSKPSKRGNGIKSQTFFSKRTNTDLFRLFTTITEVWKGIQAGAFPCNTNTWKCSSRYCQHYEGCQG
jgi:CRISPR/Cas system-associated exonuclease Cas4 (RecB family)